MAAFFSIQVDGEPVHSQQVVEYFYVLANNQLLPMQKRPCWCSGCQQFGEAEEIPTREDHDRELCELRRFWKQPGLIPPDQVHKLKDIPTETLRHEWLMQRVASPRCVECGSFEASYIQHDATTLIPEVGKCEIHWTLFDGGTTPATETKYFSAEGMPLENYA